MTATWGAPDPEFCYPSGSRSMPDPDMSDPAGSGYEPDHSHLDLSGSKPRLLPQQEKNYSFCTPTGKAGMTVYPIL